MKRDCLGIKEKKTKNSQDLYLLIEISPPKLQGAPLSIHMKQITEYILEQIHLILLGKVFFFFFFPLTIWEDLSRDLLSGSQSRLGATS